MILEINRNRAGAESLRRELVSSQGKANIKVITY
jgi:hypothetical protein